MDDSSGKAVIQKEFENALRLMFEKDRLETFDENWKELKGFKYCSPQNFASAGFYNSSSHEYQDNVKCFACQKELSDWEKNDDPWKEHVKRGSECPFVCFKSKEITTVKDFLQLQYEIKKIILNKYFEEQKKIVEDRGKALLGFIDSFK